MRPESESALKPLFGVQTRAQAISVFGGAQFMRAKAGVVVKGKRGDEGQAGRAVHKAGLLLRPGSQA